MAILRTILTVIFVLVCIAAVILVLLQEGRSAGLGAIAGGAETYWGSVPSQAERRHTGARTRDVPWKGIW